MNKQDWTYKKFEEVFDLQMGKTPDRKNLSLFGGDNIWVTIKDLGDKYIEESKEHITNEAIITTGIKRVKTGTVIMSFKLTVGKCAIAKRDLYTNEAIMAFNIKEGYTIDESFLYYYLKGYQWSGANKAVMGLTLNKASISKQMISIPPIDEQERIVEELDLLSSIIEKKKAQLKEYDQLAQSIFYSMFGDPITNEKGWDVKKLGDIGKIITGNTPSTRDERNYESDDVCFFKPSDIVKDGISHLGESEFHVSTFAYNNARKLPKGSVLVTCIGIVGKVGILEIDAMCNQQINAIIPNEDVDSVYVAYSVLSERKIIECIAHAPVVPIINKGEFSQLCVPLPPLNLQQEYAEKIEAIEKQKALVRASIAEMETLFNSRMDYYFG